MPVFMPALPDHRTAQADAPGGLLARALSSRRKLGLMLAVLGAIGFSGRSIVVKLSYQYPVDPITLLMLRMLMALPFFLLMAWWGGRGQAPLSPRDRWAVLGLGFCGYYFSSMVNFYGLQFITASLERLIMYLMPTMVLAIGWALRGQTITRGHVLATAVSYSGALLVFGTEVRLAPGLATAWGALLVLVSVASYALYLYFSGEFVGRIGSLRLVGWASTFATLFCIAHFLVVNPLASARVAEPVLWLSLLNATLCTALPVLLVMLGIEYLGARLAAQVATVGPISTIAMGIVLLGEPFTPELVAGSVLVIAGIALFGRAGRRPEPV